jgi:hypothetical protein
MKYLRNEFPFLAGVAKKLLSARTTQLHFQPPSAFWALELFDNY